MNFTDVIKQHFRRYCYLFFTKKARQRGKHNVRILAKRFQAILRTSIITNNINRDFFHLKSLLKHRHTKKLSKTTEFKAISCHMKKFYHQFSCTMKNSNIFFLCVEKNTLLFSPIALFNIHIRQIKPKRLTTIQFFFFFF